jgi:kynurenine formamidase
MFPGYKIVDLTHTITETMPTWDGKSGFSHLLHCDHDLNNEYKFRKYKINADEGIGTHMDAPIHCIPNGRTIDQISLNDLITPCVMIDVSEKANAEYKVSVQDIEEFENKYGTIGKGVFAIIYTGWSKYWNEPLKYRNELKFPMVSIEAAQLLLERGVTGLGVDTLSPDGPNEFPIHNLMLGAGKHLVENIANADQLPAIGAISNISPIKTNSGAEAPVRLIGFIPV